MSALRVVFAVVAVLAMGAGSAGAHVHRQVMVVTMQEFVPGGDAYRPVTLVEGARLFVVSLEIPGEQAVHNVAHDAPEQLFRSAEIGPGEQAEVFGADLLEPGVYRLTCEVHPFLMTGTLVVEAVLEAGPRGGRTQ